jgi:hypothetical protein
MSVGARSLSPHMKFTDPVYIVLGHYIASTLCNIIIQPVWSPHNIYWAVILVGDNSTTNRVLKIYWPCIEYPRFPRDHFKPMIFLEVCKK